MNGKIYISHRRGISDNFVKLLCLTLSNEFSFSFFISSDGIEHERHYSEAMWSAIESSDVFLAVIDLGWEEALQTHQADVNYFVITEIKTAIDQKKRVVPLLVDGANMPRVENLPYEIKALTYSPTFDFRTERFNADCQRLMSTMRDTLPKTHAERGGFAQDRWRSGVASGVAVAPAMGIPGAIGVKAVADYLREMEERAVNEQGKSIEVARKEEEALVYQSAYQIRKAEELASEDFIKQSAEQDELRHHLARLPSEAKDRLAREKLEALTNAADAEERDAMFALSAEAPNSGKLVENIPRLMRASIPCTVEVRVAKQDSAALHLGFIGQPQAHDIQATSAMTVSLQAPKGGFAIQSLSRETQWIDGAQKQTLGLLASPDYGCWKWIVTPPKPGTYPLYIVAAAKVANEGLQAEVELPEQIIEVQIRVNYYENAKYIGQWVIVGAAGGLIAEYAPTLVNLVIK